MSKNTRLNQILDYLNENKMTTIKELSEVLDVSEMTTRRDVDILRKQNNVTTFFGGVAINTTPRDSTQNQLKSPAVADKKHYEYEDEFNQYLDQKKRIAQKAASFIEPNDAIFIDAGSTTRQIVNYLPSSTIMVYSHSLATLNDLCDVESIKLIGCSGLYHKNTKTFESAEATQLIEKASINSAFLSARGISEHGITTAETFELDIKKAAIRASKQKILLIDSSKFGKTWYAKYAELSDIDIVITDNNVSDEFLELLESRNIKVYVV